MEYINVNNDNNSRTTTYTRVDGPVGDIISLIIAIPIFIIGLVMLVILGLSLINDYKTRNYVKTDGIITNHVVEEEMNYYSISFKTNQNEQTVDHIFGVSGYNVGDKVKIMYNPNEITNVTFVSNSFGFMFYCLLALFLSSIFVIIRRIKNIMHYINPQKYEKSKEKPYISLSVGNTSEDIFNDKFRGNGTQIKL